MSHDSIESEGDHRDPPDSADRQDKDCFGPPDEPCECYCLHCGRVFMSDKIWFQKIVGDSKGLDGFWMCPTANCSGAGFTFDIFPTDPAHPANAGWCDDDDDAEWSEDDEFDEFNDGEEAGEKEWDPEESEYAQFDDDLEGEEWKHGLQPGERPPEPRWRAEARKQWEDEQRKYDEPDQRPRELDWSDRQYPPSIGDDDIPF